MSRENRKTSSLLDGSKYIPEKEIERSEEQRETNTYDAFRRVDNFGKGSNPDADNLDALFHGIGAISSDGRNVNEYAAPIPATRDNQVRTDNQPLQQHINGADAEPVKTPVYISGKGDEIGTEKMPDNAMQQHYEVKNDTITERSSMVEPQRQQYAGKEPEVILPRQSATEWENARGVTPYEKAVASQANMPNINYVPVQPNPQIQQMPPQMPSQMRPQQVQPQYQASARNYEEETHNNNYMYSSLEKPESQYRAYRKEIICVHSPKGGVGKSTISKELAIALAKKAPHKKAYKVLLVDADWEFGDVATMLNVTPVPNVSYWVKDMLLDKEQYQRIPLYPVQDIMSRYIISMKKIRPDLELDILAGSGNAADAALIDEEIVNALLDNLLRCDYDFIILDSANSLHPKTVTTLMRCDKMVLVETLDTTTITETTVLLDTLRSKQFDFNKLLMVLNQVPSDEKKLDISVSELERLLKMEMTAIIPAHGDVRLRNNAGESLIEGKDSVLTKEIRKLANAVAPVYEEKRVGLLSKIFKRK